MAKKMSAAVTPQVNETAEERELRIKLLAVEAQMRGLELEDLEERISDRRQQKAEQKRRAQQAERTLEDSRREDLARQASCAHRKGGKDYAGVLRGNDPNYSVIQHTYPWGETRISCTRCGKEVAPPTEALRLADPVAFAIALQEYKVWLNLPTDNTPSGSQLFGFSGGERPQGMVLPKT